MSEVLVSGDLVRNLAVAMARVPAKLLQDVAEIRDVAVAANALARDQLEVEPTVLFEQAGPLSLGPALAERKCWVER